MKGTQRNAKNMKNHQKSYPKDDYSDSENDSYDESYDESESYSDESERVVNKRITIDIRENFGLADIVKKIKYNEYRKGKKKSGKININLIVEDLKKCLVVILQANPTFIVKDYDADNRIYKLSYCNQSTISSTLNLIKIGKVKIDGVKKKAAKLWDIVIGYLSEFTYTGTAFYSDEPDVFSTFRGYDYKVLDDVDMDLISPFLNHIRNVIAGGNEKIYTYILNWIAKILQVPDYQTSVVLMILGLPGSGKNTFTEVITQLMRRYSQPNLSMNSVIGSWNTLLRNMKLVVVNELQSQTNINNRYKDGEDLKTIITEDTIVIREKYVNDITMKNVCNFIMISNNNTPFRIEMGDRRYLVLRTIDEYANNKVKGKAYFDKLYKTIETEGFYENLFTYFMKYDTKYYSLTPVPRTKEWWRIVKATMPTQLLYFTENYKEYNGVRDHKYLHEEIYAKYEEFCRDHRRQPVHVDTFIGEISPYLKKVHTTRRDLGTKKVHLYYLNDEYYKRFEDEAKNMEEIVEEINEGEITEKDEELVIGKFALMDIMKKIQQGKLNNDDIIQELRLCSGMNMDGVELDVLLNDKESERSEQRDDKEDNNEEEEEE